MLVFQRCPRIFFGKTVCAEKLMHTSEGVEILEKAKKVDRKSEIWQLHKNTWEELPSVPYWSSSLSRIAACWVPGGFVVSGGFDIHGGIRDVCMFKADTMKWERLPPPP
jgi:hypothetical protein